MNVAELARAMPASAETARRDAEGLGSFLRTCGKAGTEGRSDAHHVLGVLVGHVIARLRSGDGDPDLIPGWLARALTLESKPANPAGRA